MKNFDRRIAAELTRAMLPLAVESPGFSGKFNDDPVGTTYDIYSRMLELVDRRRPLTHEERLRVRELARQREKHECDIEALK